MIEMVIWLVVIAAFVFRALKKNGTLDELFAGAKKRKENKAERVVYEQPEEGSGKKEKKKKGPGIRVPKHTGLAVTAVVIVLAAAVLSFDSFYTLSEEEMAVVTTFGKPAVEEASGLHFKIPVIQRVTKVSKAITGMQIGYTTDPARADGASIDNPVSIENESLMITTDKDRIFQVISNLIGNAVKFTKEGSISYGYKLVDNQIVFHVTDTGTGIEPEKVGRVFERFAKLNNHAQGTGLGLSICKSIVERLGGKISVSSEFGKGTTFTFTLPYTVAESVSVDSEKKNDDETSGGMSSAVNTRHACILVAEDTDSNFDLLEAILGKEHRIIRAHDGMEVVTMFDEVKPDLILMDIKMPNLDGLEATKIIRELSATVPIIAQSAFAYEQDRKAAKEAGCNDFIAKPIADDKLKAMIHKWLSPP